MGDSGRREARAAREAEIRERLEADIRASTNFIFGGGPPNPNNNVAGRAEARQQQRDEAINARVHRAAMTAAGVYMNHGPIFPPGVARGVARRGAAPAPTAGAHRSATRGRRLVSEAGEEDMFVACPHCFKPIFGSALANHLLTQCGAVPAERAPKLEAKGEPEEPASVYSDPLRAQQDREFAEALASDQEKDRMAATSAAIDDSPATATRFGQGTASLSATSSALDSSAAVVAGEETEAGKQARREAAAAAALRRLQLSQQQPETPATPVETPL